MTTDKKIIAGIIAATIAILVGAVFFFSQPAKPPSTSKVDTSVLGRSDSQKISSDSAKVTLVEFADFQCPACGAYYSVVNQLITQFKGDLTFVYRHFPLPQHQNARLAAYVSEAAGNQNKFFEMEDMLFTNQKDWSEKGNAKDIFISYAENLKLNLDQFKKDIDSDAIKKKVDRDQQDGNSLGVNSTPTFFLDGEKIKNPGSFEDFQTLIKAAILKAPMTQTETEKYHTHFNLKVVLASGQAMDFTQNKYQSTKEKELNPNIHFHDGVGDLVHIHKKGMPLGDLFKSLKISFNKDCLKLDTGEEFCSQENQKLQIFVNGKSNNQFENYLPQDLDRILIVYVIDDTSIQQLISSVSDTACIYSEKCPERGKPPTEECVGGLGTGCE